MYSLEYHNRFLDIGCIQIMIAKTLFRMIFFRLLISLKQRPFMVDTKLFLLLHNCIEIILRNLSLLQWGY